MTTHVWVLSVALAATALLSWGAVLRGDYEVERITRPTFVVLVLGLAWSLYSDGRSVSDSVALPLFVALTLALLGDMLLLTATAVRYRLALLVLIAGQAALIRAVLDLPVGGTFPWAVIPTVATLVAVHGSLGRHVVRFARRDRGLVLLAHLVTMALVVVAALRADWVVLTAAVLLLGSGLILGHDRFVRARRFAPAQAVATCQAAQVLIVVGLLR